MTNLMLRPTFFQDLFDFRRDFDRVFDRFFSNWPALGETNTGVVSFIPPVEAWIDREAKQYCLQVALPGVDPSQVEVQAHGNTLTIRGTRTASRQADTVDYLHQEFTYGSFERTLVLPEGVEADRLNAEYRNGLLVLTAPVKSAALPRRIEIKGLPASVQKAA